MSKQRGRSDPFCADGRGFVRSCTTPDHVTAASRSSFLPSPAASVRLIFCPHYPLSLALTLPLAKVSLFSVALLTDRANRWTNGDIWQLAFFPALSRVALIFPMYYKESVIADHLRFQTSQLYSAKSINGTCRREALKYFSIPCGHFYSTFFGKFAALQGSRGAAAAQKNFLRLPCVCVQESGPASALSEKVASCFILDSPAPSPTAKTLLRLFS